jgi:6-phosphogluconolactonase
VHEWSCSIDVYSYEERKGEPVFDKIQTVLTVKPEKGSTNAASALSFNADYKYLLSSNAGDNSVVVYSVDMESGLLTEKFCLPVSGDYPKDAEFFPNNKFLVSLNHESNNMTFFHLDLDAGSMIMNGPAINVDVPNCIMFYKLGSTSRD